MALLLKRTRRRFDDAADDRRMWSVATVFTRVALSAGFLSAVADRFGLWGPAGTANVSWGGFEPYLAYVAALAPYLPAPLLGVAGWGATLAELALGLTLLLGVALRWSAWLSVATLLVFGLSMFLFAGFEAPLSASVFSACAAALLLALSPAHGHAFTVDGLRRQGR
ncbi:hypothetical protein [Pseudonocardia sp. MH-G8]|uniref:hypothetical protein n=1 Tax=Pseudonocardia sp. MH-G8 TaxID=1854588 RepID=UPI0018E90F12|nr:hypothetical protein [Pseudonocardia sp. MH-G8]